MYFLYIVISQSFFHPTWSKHIIPIRRLRFLTRAGSSAWCFSYPGAPISSWPAGSSSSRRRLTATVGRGFSGWFHQILQLTYLSQVFCLAVTWPGGPGLWHPLPSWTWPSFARTRPRRRLFSSGNMMSDMISLNPSQADFSGLNGAKDLHLSSFLQINTFSNKRTQVAKKISLFQKLKMTKKTRRRGRGDRPGRGGGRGWRGWWASSEGGTGRLKPTNSTLRGNSCK